MKHKKKLLTFLLLCCFAVTALAGCGGDNTESSELPPVRIACKTMPEQMILQEILAQLIETKTSYTVERVEPIAGGTSNIQVAIENNELDLYPEYTGTGWLTVLKNEETKDEDYMFTELNKQYNENFNMSWLALYGFENTYTLAVRAETAEQYNLTKISDLAAVSDQLVFGANFDYFEREDGYAKVCATYGLNFKDTAEVDMGLKYQALMEKQCDVLNAYTTDSQIAEFGLVTLEDDLGLFTDYRCSTVVRNQALETYPELRDVLMLMEGLISNEEMTQMNYELNSQHRLESEIAAEFLQSKGMI
ncbi:MAG: glycine/betaine ABC transporter substrate-binding protein [Peptococcaceae bacterium]|nr:glycine/betaine ABC transporter substrate-binding protein [Peptococcaceae bacterium]